MGKDGPDQQDQYSQEETEQRVQRALKGAFAGQATSFKMMPRKPRARRKTNSPKALKKA